MDFMAEETSTRKNIIHHLKKSGGMSIDELSREISITPMGVRQHLLSLEKKGLVTYTSRRQGIGRPGFIYKLTDNANNLFRNDYDDFALNLLRDIKNYEGPEKIDRIFSWRKERLLKEYREALAGKTGIDDTVTGLKQYLERRGNLVELNRNDTSYQLKQYHCPISRIATEFPEACAHELQLYRELLGKKVTREHTVADGAASCLYIIPRN